MGIVPNGHALKRATAHIGDAIFMTGKLGDAGLGLKIKQGYMHKDAQEALNRFHAPLPQVDAGLALQGIASACIDISDGLVSDLGHILKQSGVGACIEWEKLPFSSCVKSYIEQTGDALMPLISGDDYELCFTVPEKLVHCVPDNCTQIGTIEAQLGLRLLKAGHIDTLTAKGYEHFS